MNAGGGQDYGTSEVLVMGAHNYGANKKQALSDHGRRGYGYLRLARASS